MKTITILLAALLLGGCAKSQKTEISINPEGVSFLNERDCKMVFEYVSSNTDEVLDRLATGEIKPEHIRRIETDCSQNRHFMELQKEVFRGYQESLDKFIKEAAKAAP